MRKRRLYRKINKLGELNVLWERATILLSPTTNCDKLSDVDKAAMAQILTYPNAYIGLSDGGAHVQFHGGYGYSTRLLGYWVRQEGIMSLEQAVRRLTFESASTFGIFFFDVPPPTEIYAISLHTPALLTR